MSGASPSRSPPHEVIHVEDSPSPPKQQQPAKRSRSEDMADSWKSGLDLASSGAPPSALSSAGDCVVVDGHASSIPATTAVARAGASVGAVGVGLGPTAPPNFFDNPALAKFPFVPPPLIVTKSSSATAAAAAAAATEAPLGSSLAAAAVSEWPETVKVLTWNIAECEPSARAPETWTKVEAQRAICAAILSHNADIVCVQEAPSSSFPLNGDGGDGGGARGSAGAGALGKEELRDYALLGATTSHCGYVMLFLRLSLLSLVDKVTIKGPAVCANFHGGVSVASMHLQPFPGKPNGDKRIRQTQDIISVCHPDIIIAGDANMRANEAKELESLAKASGAPLTDVHDRLCRGKPCTWDSRVNLYHADGFPFACNFDRIFVGGRMEPTACTVVCNTPASADKAHFLSDHYALLATVRRRK